MLNESGRPKCHHVACRQYWRMGVVSKRLLAAAVLILLIAGCWITFRQNPSPKPIHSSRETTYFTFADKETRDYSARLDELWLQRVAGSDNAAVPLLEGTWPADPVDKQYAHVSEHLRTVANPNYEEGLLGETIRAEVQRWLAGKKGPPMAGQQDECTAAFAILEARRAAWKATDIPPLSDWVVRQKNRLDRLATITECKTFYCPDPARLANEAGWVGSHSSFVSEQITMAAAAMALRSMFMAGENRPAAAWNDIKTIYALSMLKNCQTPDDVAARLAIRRQAYHATMVLVSSGVCNEPLLNEIDDYLSRLESSRDLLEDAVLFLRIAAIDAFQRFYEGRDVTQFKWFTGVSKEQVLAKGIDPNTVLRHINGQCTAIDKKLSSSDNHVLDRIQAISDYSEVCGRRSLIGDKQSESSSESLEILLANTVLAKLDPQYLLEVCLACEANDVHGEIVRVGVALERFKNESGEYPGNLSRLKTLDDALLTKDPFTLSSLTYNRVGKGYLLYSYGLDQTDNEGSGGDAIVGMIQDGEWAIGRVPRPGSGADIVLRIPIPPVNVCRNSDVGELLEEL